MVEGQCLKLCWGQVVESRMNPLSYVLDLQLVANRPFIRSSLFEQSRQILCHNSVLAPLSVPHRSAPSQPQTNALVEFHVTKRLISHLLSAMLNLCQISPIWGL